MFERFVNRKRAALGKPKWEHEDASIALLRLLLQTNDINVQDYKLEPCDVNFVCHLIEVRCHCLFVLCRVVGRGFVML